MSREEKAVTVRFSRAGLRARNRELSLLIEMSNALAEFQDLDRLLRNALSRVLDFFGLEAGRIYLMDPDGRALSLAAHQGMEPEGLERIRIDEGFSGKAARTKSFIVQDVSMLEDKNRAAFLSQKGFKTIICVPLMSRGRVEGIMNLATGNKIEIEQNHIDLATALGNQIAVAISKNTLYEDLKKKIEDLKKKKEMIKFFAYSVSHDLKSPANSIYSLALRLRERYCHNMDEKAQEHCRMIAKTAENMIALIQKINEFVVAKEAPFKFEKINAGEITNLVRKEFMPRLKDRNVKWTEPYLLPEITADRLSLCRVFQNFVDNSLKYGGEDLSEIEIGYHAEDAFHVFSYRDDGVGISGPDMQEVFEVFRREKTSSGTAGSGLGLAIVKEIAERHEGRVWIETQEKKGTKLCLSLSRHLKVTDKHPQKESKERRE